MISLRYLAAACAVLAALVASLAGCSRKETLPAAPVVSAPQSETGRAAAEALHRPLDAARSVEGIEAKHADDTRRQIDGASQ